MAPQFPNADSRGLGSVNAPRVLVQTGDPAPDGAAGAVWSITGEDRDLDANLIVLPPGDGIGSHIGAEVDVLIHVVSGGGVLITERAEIPLVPGTVAYLPRHSRRGFRAGPEGLRYLTVHRRRESLVVRSAR